MKNVALILCGLLASAQGRTIDINAIFKPRIYDGVEVKLGEIPYQVSLQGNYGHFCGGSILNEHWVITAAHCVEGSSASEVAIAAGSISLQNPYSVHQAVQIIVHENFARSNSYIHDIALIKVATPFEFSFRIKPVTLPKPHATVETNSLAVVSGWGETENGSSPDKLRKATLYITDPKFCQAAVQPEGFNVHPTQVCVRNPDKYRGSCYGDSGGPVTVDDVLTGLVSWSVKLDGCASPHYPGVHTRVSEYIDWIQQHIE